MQYSPPAPAPHQSRQENLCVQVGEQSSQLQSLTEDKLECCKTAMRGFAVALNTVILLFVCFSAVAYLKGDHETV